MSPQRPPLFARLCRRCLSGLVLLAGLNLSATAVANDTWQAAPPRLSLTDGQAFFWRPGTDNWNPAQINTPLAKGDALLTGASADLEIQIAPRAFARIAEHSQLQVAELDGNLIQLQISSGTLSLDVRALPDGQRLLVNSPNGKLNIAAPGYYRIGALPDGDRFTVRRGGRASLVLDDGSGQWLASGEEALVRPDAPIQAYAAPPADAWDNWSDRRSANAEAALSSRRLAPEIYGIGDLDQYGSWRTIAPYGTVWQPESVSANWVPYSTGSWVNDPYYGWTWVDQAPWGWAPYHYGRWLQINGRWAWAPGPRISRPSYAPALVAFYRGGAVTVADPPHQAGVSWVALSWGEPVLPWWGGNAFRAAPWWGGWGGPRLVNNHPAPSHGYVDAQRLEFHNAAIPGAMQAAHGAYNGHDFNHGQAPAMMARPQPWTGLGTSPSAPAGAPGRWSAPPTRPAASLPQPVHIMPSTPASTPYRAPPSASPPEPMLHQAEHEHRDSRRFIAPDPWAHRDDSRPATPSAPSSPATPASPVTPPAHRTMPTPAAVAQPVAPMVPARPAQAAPTAVVVPTAPVAVAAPPARAMERHEERHDFHPRHDETVIRTSPPAPAVPRVDAAPRAMVPVKVDAPSRPAAPSAPPAAVAKPVAAPVAIPVAKPVAAPLAAPARPQPGEERPEHRGQESRGGPGGPFPREHGER